MYLFPKVKILGTDLLGIGIQAGMGALVSLPPIAAAAARRGWIGVVTSVGLDQANARSGERISYQDATRLEVEKAILLSEGLGSIFVNCMARVSTYEESVFGAVAGGARGFIVGAGLPLSLPGLVDKAKDRAGINHEIALLPIVSSVRALDIICRKWAQVGRKPDAVVLEGPLAGGHLGYSAAEIDDPAFSLEKIFPMVLEYANDHGFPVIVAGGIWDRPGIVRWLEAGAGGVQIGTRFLATHESSATDEFKRRVVAATADDIIVAIDPGSPSGMPFRIIADSAGYQKALKRVTTPKCKWGYLLHNGECMALKSPRHFCICDALLAAAGKNSDPESLPIFTVGTNAARVDRIMSVDELITELTGYPV